MVSRDARTAFRPQAATPGASRRSGRPRRGDCLPAICWPRATSGCPAAKFKVTDVNSHSLGIEGLDTSARGCKENVILIPRNTRAAVSGQRRNSSRNGRPAVGRRAGAGGREQVAGRVHADRPRRDAAIAAAAAQGNQDRGFVSSMRTNGRLSVRAKVRGTPNELKIELERESGLSDDRLARWKRIVTGDDGLRRVWPRARREHAQAKPAARPDSAAGVGAVGRRQPRAPLPLAAAYLRRPRSPQAVQSWASGGKSGSVPAPRSAWSAVPSPPACAAPGRGAADGAKSNSSGRWSSKRHAAARDALQPAVARMRSPKAAAGAAADDHQPLRAHHGGDAGADDRLLHVVYNLARIECFATGVAGGAGACTSGDPAAPEHGRVVRPSPEDKSGALDRARSPAADAACAPSAERLRRFQPFFRCWPYDVTSPMRKRHRRSASTWGRRISAVALSGRSGRPVTLVNAEGDLVTPSVVLFEGSERGGRQGGDQGHRHRGRSVAQCAKRELGARTFHKNLQGRKYPPEAIQAFVLNKVKQDAQRQHGQLSQGRHHRAGLFRRSPPQGHAGRRLHGRPGSARHHQRADRRGDRARLSARIS